MCGELLGTNGALAGVALETILDQKLLSPNDFRLSTSSGQTQSKKAIEAGIEVRRGNFHDPESFVHSFEGADAVF